MSEMNTSIERMVQIVSNGVRLEGILCVPDGVTGIVLFAHGSGSGRFSPRNQFVAQELRNGGLATLLFDLLEEWESEDRDKVFDINFLADRLLGATDWVQSNPDTKELAIGYFGASTGAAAALQAAAKRGSAIKAVVTRGGRPDLAMEYLPKVTAPTLLIVGGEDWPVISLNQEAFDSLSGIKKMEIIPGATHLFEESGALEEVARLARDWFAEYLK